MRMKSTELSREIVVGISKSGILKWWHRGANPRLEEALPIFSVHTEEQARDLFVRFGRKAYDSDTYIWTGFNGSVESLPGIGQEIATWWCGTRS